jgi:hypothetical protein
MLRQLNTGSRQAVEVRSGDISTVERDIAPTEIVGKDDNDVGTLASRFD